MPLRWCTITHSAVIFLIATGKLLVTNQPSYDVMVIPRNVKLLDTLEFCALLKNYQGRFYFHLQKTASILHDCLRYLFPNWLKANMLRFLKNVGKYEGFYIQKDR